METFAYALLGLFGIGYFVLGGADIGVGMLLPFLGRDRRLTIAAIAPFFLGNEVWLVATAGLLTALFPVMEGQVFGQVWGALVVLVSGWIVRDMGLWLRGRQDEATWQRFWDGATVAGSWAVAASWGVAIGQLMGGGAPLFAVTTCGLFALHGAVFAALRLGSEEPRALARRLVPVVLVAGVPCAFGAGIDHLGRTTPLAAGLRRAARAGLVRAGHAEVRRGAGDVRAGDRRRAAAGRGEPAGRRRRGRRVADADRDRGDGAAADRRAGVGLVDVPRPGRRAVVPVTYVLLALAQGLLVVGQADLLSRVLAGSSLLLPLVLVVAGRAALTLGQGTVFGWTAARRKRVLRSRLLERGADVTLLGRGLDALDPYYAGYLPQRYAAAVVPVLVLLRLAVADWPSALVIAVTLPLIPVFGALVGRHTKQATARQWGQLHRLGGHFLDVVAGLPTLRAYGRDAAQTSVVRAMADGHRRATTRTLRIAFLSSFVLEIVATLSVALVAVPAGLRLLSGSLSLRVALLVLLLAPEAYLPLRLLGTRFHAAAEGRAVLDQIPDAPPPSGSVHPVPGRLEISEIVVRYEGAAALDGFSLTVEPGERVALTGPSGAGKSTLLRAVLGFAPVSSGRILVGGVDLTELDLFAWRGQVAYVPQRPHLFAGTVADNLRLGRPEASEAEVRRAAEAAAAHDFIAELPDGYRTELGERGLGLSTGQRQRLAIARAYLMDAPIVILDEPTARLDLRSEALVTEAAARLLEGRTALLVAHRPALLSLADRVVHLTPREVPA